MEASIRIELEHQHPFAVHLRACVKYSHCLTELCNSAAAAAAHLYFAPATLLRCHINNTKRTLVTTCMLTFSFTFSKSTRALRKSLQKRQPICLSNKDLCLNPSETRNELPVREKKSEQSGRVASATVSANSHSASFFFLNLKRLYTD